MKGNMKKTILSYPDYLNALFNEDIVFTIHSSFKNTINLNHKNTLISLQHRDLMLTPMSIRLDLSPFEFSNMFFNQSNLIYIRDRILYVNEVMFELNNTKMENLKIIENLNIDYKCNLYKNLNDYLLNSIKNGEMIKAFKRLNGKNTNDTSILSDYFYAIFKKLESLMLHDDCDQYLPLIGVGEGLTPSGDDFLCGLIASTYFINNVELNKLREMLKEKLPPLLNKTTDISRAYLLNSLEGQFMEGLIRLHEVSVKREDVEPILNEISAMGHSSGTDFLVGLHFGLKLGGTKE